MKITFDKKDGLYKIFKSIEKISTKKTVEIFIDPKNPFFENQRRGIQIKQLLEKKEIDYIFISGNTQAKDFFQNVGLKYIMNKKSPLVSTLEAFYFFFFEAKKFHLYILSKKNYSMYFLFGIEFVVIIGVLYMLYTLILPSATIYIRPTFSAEDITYNYRFFPNEHKDFPSESRFISIPYYSGSIGYKHTMSINLSNITFNQKPAKGKIKLTNTTQQSYSLLVNTKLITNDGLLFKIPAWTTLPGAKGGIPGEIEIEVEAMEKDNVNTIIGERGNISQGTNLYIKNLKASNQEKKIVAVALTDFKGGTTIPLGNVEQENIDTFKKRLSEFIETNKKKILKQKFDQEDSYLLPFDDLISFHIQSININEKVGDQTPVLNGTIEVIFHYPFTYWKDIENAVRNYLQQRPSENIDLTDLNKSSLTFYEKRTIENSKVFIVPTKISTIRGYNFSKDVNGIKELIKEKIVGLNAEDAKKAILSFPEISATVVNISPAWYDTIPKIKSRIKFIVK